MNQRCHTARPAAILSLAFLIAIPSFATRPDSGRYGQSTGGSGPARQAVLSFEVRPTVFFIRDGGSLKQLLTLSVDNSGPASAGTLAVSVEGRDLTFPLNSIPAGKNSFPVAVPEIT